MQYIFVCREKKVGGSFWPPPTLCYRNLLYQFHEYQEPGYYKAQEGSHCNKECIPRPGNLLRFFLFLFHHL